MRAIVVHWKLKPLARTLTTLLHKRTK
jgi:hypothetical protein